MAEGQKSLAEAIDVIEETYEFLLAYAAQGHSRDAEDAGSGVRDRLARAEAALGVVVAATTETIPAATPQTAALQEFLDLVRADARRARTAFRFVLAQRSVGSQIIDNLNATTHMRTLLTDLFLLDEAAKISGI